MRDAIRAWMALMAVWGVIALSQYLDRKDKELFNSIFDRASYPQHPGKWRDMSIEYRMQYTLRYQDEVASRISKSAACGALAQFVLYGGITAIVIWLLFDLERGKA